MKTIAVSIAALCTLTSTARAEDAPTTETPAAAPAATTEAPAATAPPAEGPAATAEAPTTAPMEATGAVAEKSPAPLHLMFFADAYANWQSAQPGTSAPWHRAYDSSAFGNGSQNGFSLAFTGLDVSYVGTGWGATTSLRFGPAVPQFYASDTGPFGIDNITEAYVTWAPVS